MKQPEPTLQWFRRLVKGRMPRPLPQGTRGPDGNPSSHRVTGF